MGVEKTAKALKFSRFSSPYECEGWGFESLMAHHIENAEISKVSAFFIALNFVKKCKKIRLNGAK